MTQTAADSTAPAKSAVLLALTAVYVIWGSTYLVMRMALESYPPFLMAAFRFLLAGGAMYGFLRLRGAPRPTPRQWAHSLIVGTLLLAIGNGFVALAEQWVASSLAAVMVASMPLYAAVFSGLFGKWPGPWEWAGLALGAAGVVLLNLDGDLRASIAGAAALVISPVCWAFGSVLSRRLTLPKGPMASATQMLTGGAVLSVAGAFQWNQLHIPTLRSTAALLYLAAFGSIIGYSAYVYLLGAVRPALATSYAYVNPLVAVVLGITIGGETITRLGALGTALILFAVVLVALGGSRRARLPAGSAPVASSGSALPAVAGGETTPPDAPRAA